METNKVSVARAGKVIGLFSIQEIRQGMAAQKVLASDYWYDSTTRQWFRFSDKFPQASPPPIPAGLTTPPSIPSQSRSPKDADTPDPWLVSKDWKTPPGAESGDTKPATWQKAILTNYGLQIPTDLKYNQASAWIHKLPRYPVVEEDAEKPYGLKDWNRCPPREKRTDKTKPASAKQIGVIKSHELEPPNDLTSAEASRWIDTLFDSPDARYHLMKIQMKLEAAERFFKGVRAHRTKGNSQRLTSEILNTVIYSLYEERPELFAETETENEYGGTYSKFSNSRGLADAFMERMRRDYPGCVDGNAPAPRARPAPAPAPSIPAATGKGCAVLLLPPLFALAWMASA